MKLPTRFLSILSLALWMIGSSLAPSVLGLADAEAQSRKEEKRKKVLDYKAYERDRNREAYGELANQKRQEAITQLKQILGDQKRLPADTKAEMLMRLAELYFEQSKYEYNREMDVYDELYEKWFKW